MPSPKKKRFVRGLFLPNNVCPCCKGPAIRSDCRCGACSLSCKKQEDGTYTPGSLCPTKRREQAQAVEAARVAALPSVREEPALPATPRSDTAMW